MFERYGDYIKDNPKGYWFKAKIYGWGWCPVKWQGWAVILVFILWIALSEKYFLMNGMIFEFFAALIIDMIVLIAIAAIKGEKPRWQWGLPKEPKKQELSIVKKPRFYAVF